MITGRLLVANRGEIAIRIFRAAAELGLESVAVYPADDAASLHTRKADAARQLPGRGVAAYLDGDAIIAVARETGADGDPSGLRLPVGERGLRAGAAPRPASRSSVPAPTRSPALATSTRRASSQPSFGVPTLPGTAAPDDRRRRRAPSCGALGPDGAVMVKAVAGGGGRGMRPVHGDSALEEAFARCRSEAQSGFGNGDLFVERLVRDGAPYRGAGDRRRPRGVAPVGARLLACSAAARRSSRSRRRRVSAPGCAIG